MFKKNKILKHFKQNFNEFLYRFEHNETVK